MPRTSTKIASRTNGNSTPSRRTRGRGRPVEKPLPPRIDATPEMIAQAFFQTVPDQFEESDYTCKRCGHSVEYPDVLFEDGDCSVCHLE